MSDGTLKPCAWTHDAEEVLVLKCVPADGKVTGSRSDGLAEKYGPTYAFAWPLVVGAEVEAPDWEPTSGCGGGLHGWPWGLAIGNGKDPDWAATWLVFGARPEDVVDLSGKCKARRGVIRHVGTWQSATAFVLSGQMALIAHTANGNHSATGYRSASSATGYRSASSATGDSSASSATGYSSASSATGYSSASSATGDSSASSATGDSSASSATGYRSASSATGDSSASSATGYSSASSATGDSSASSATGYSSASSATGYSSASSATGYSSASSATGYSSASSATGYSSAAVVTGLCGKAQCGPFGCIALGWWNAKANRSEMRCAEVGIGDGSDGKLKAKVWYSLNKNGLFVEVTA